MSRARCLSLLCSQFLRLVCSKRNGASSWLWCRLRCHFSNTLVLRCTVGSFVSLSKSHPFCRRCRGDRCRYCLIFQPLSLIHRDLCLLARETLSCFLLLFSSVSSGFVRYPASITRLAHILTSQSMLVL